MARTEGSVLPGPGAKIRITNPKMPVGSDFPEFKGDSLTGLKGFIANIDFAVKEFPYEVRVAGIDYPILLSANDFEVL